MGLGAAVVGAAGLGLVGSSMQANAAQQASQQQYAADQSALAQQKSMFGTAQNALSPYYQAGQSVLPTLQNLLTPGQSASALAQMPGFQFQSQYGNLAATNQLAAQGLGGSGGPLGTALSNYNQGLAGTYYTNTTNALQNYANMGSSAASALAGDAISSGNAQAATTQAAGNALASGTLGSASATSSGLSGASNALLLSSLMGNSSGGGTFNTSLPNNTNGTLIGYNV